MSKQNNNTSNRPIVRPTFERPASGRPTVVSPTVNRPIGVPNGGSHGYVPAAPPPEPKPKK
jgi:hypothetical protein